MSAAARSRNALAPGGDLSGVVTVEIAGQRYPVRSGLDPAYVGELAAYVDQKMRAASDAAPTIDMLGLAILVALNLADEYFRARQLQSVSNGEFNERALRLEQLVDEVLSDASFPRKAGSAHI